MVIIGGWDFEESGYEVFDSVVGAYDGLAGDFALVAAVSQLGMLMGGLLMI